MTRVIPKPKAKPFVKVVFPAPKSPDKIIVLLGKASFANNSPIFIVSSCDVV